MWSMMEVSLGCDAYSQHKDVQPWLCPRNELTKGDDDRAGDAVCNDHAEDIQHPCVLSPVLEVYGLALG